MARNFDAIDDRITAPTVNVTGDWTMGVWFNANTAGEGGLGAIIWVEPSPNGTVVATIRFDNSGSRIHAHQGHALINATAKTEAFAFGVWSLIFCTYTASDARLRFYKGTVSDAVAATALTSQVAGTGAQTTNGGVITVGNRVATDFTFDGATTRPLYAARVLTLAEMEAFRASYTVPATLLGHWPYTETTGTTANDVSGNNRHGTISGATFVDDPAFPGVSSASGALVAPAPVASGTATAIASATGAVSAPAATMAGTATAPVAASGALTVPPAIAAGTATAPTSASGDLAAPMATASGTATATASADGAVTAPAATASGTLTAPVALSGALVAPAATSSGTVAVVATASGVLTAPTPTASGQITTEGSPTSASGALVAPMPTASGTATATVTASGALTAPAPTAAGTATVDVDREATGALTAPTATASGTVAVVVTTSGDVTSPAPILVGSMVQVAAGSNPIPMHPDRVGAAIGQHPARVGVAIDQHPARDGAAVPMYP